MSEINILPLPEGKDDQINPQNDPAPTEIVQTHRQVAPGLEQPNKEVQAHQPIHIQDQGRKKKIGRPITTGKGIRKTNEKHVMTQARLDGLARARKIRTEKIKARNILKKAEQEEQKTLLQLGKMVVNNANLAALEQKNNLQVEAGKVDVLIQETNNPITSLQSHKNMHLPVATVGEEFRQPNPGEPVRTVVFRDNGGLTQTVFKKDLTFTL